MANKFSEPCELHRLVMSLSNLLNYWIEAKTLRETTTVFKILAKAIKNALEKREVDETNSEDEDFDDDDDYNEDFERRNDYSHLYDSPMEKIDEVMHFINLLS